MIRFATWPQGRWLLLVVGGWLGLSLIMAQLPAAQAQTDSQPPAPGDVSRGLGIYTARCATCHGLSGLGDGEQAAQAILPPTPLADPAYLASALPAAMSEIIRAGRMESGMPPFGEASSNPLSPQDRADVIAAIYALGTNYVELEAGRVALESADLADRLATVDWFNLTNQGVMASLADSGLPEETLRQVVDYARLNALDYFIEGAGVAGQLINGSTGVPVGGVPITLELFERFNPLSTLTTTVAADGFFSFTLPTVAPDWVAFTTVNYSGLDYPSPFVRFSREAPLQEASITVYEPTSDAAVVDLQQVHLILEFSGDVVTVNEFYGFGTNQPFIYVGPSGDPVQGTVTIALPAGAEPTVLRTTQSSGNFFPADDILRHGDRLQEVNAIFPGSNTLGVLVRYTLPYEDGLQISHALDYAPAQVSLIMPDVGVQLAEDPAWQGQGSQSLQGESFVSYVGTATDEIRFTLEGRPRSSGVTGSALQAGRNLTTELLIGSALLIGAAALAGIFIRQWREAPPADPEPLLQALADLDDAYANGRIPRPTYLARRQKLKNQLLEMWPSRPAGE